MALLQMHRRKGTRQQSACGLKLGCDLGCVCSGTPADANRSSWQPDPHVMGADEVLQSCVKHCRCRFMVVNWHWNSSVLCCSVPCWWYSAFFNYQYDEQIFWGLWRMHRLLWKWFLSCWMQVLFLHCIVNLHFAESCHAINRDEGNTR